MRRALRSAVTRQWDQGDRGQEPLRGSGKVTQREVVRAETGGSGPRLSCVTHSKNQLGRP